MKILIYVIPALLAVTVRADDITLADGKTVFHNAKIVSQDAASVTIRHSVGIARVMIPELPPELRAKIKYDSDEAAKLLQNEQRSTAQMNVLAARDIAESRKRDTEEKEAYATREAWQKSLQRMSGKITQITDEGVFILQDNAEHVVFIKHANAGNYVDGDYVSVFAAPCGSYNYSNVRGSGSTVRAFDAAPPAETRKTVSDAGQ